MLVWNFFAGESVTNCTKYTESFKILHAVLVDKKGGTLLYSEVTRNSAMWTKSMGWKTLLCQVKYWAGVKSVTPFCLSCESCNSVEELWLGQRNVWRALPVSDSRAKDLGHYKPRGRVENRSFALILEPEKCVLVLENPRGERGRRSEYKQHKQWVRKMGYSTIGFYRMRTHIDRFIVINVGDSRVNQPLAFSSFSLE